MSSSFPVRGDTQLPNLELAFARVGSSEAGGSALRQDLLETWVAVTDAGGAVGFTAPADADEVKATLDAALKGVAVGRDALGVLRNGDTIVGMGFLVDRSSALARHWRTVLRVMVRPELQGVGGSGGMSAAYAG